MTDAIAIVGMGCRFPGSPDVPSFWRTIRNGAVCVRDIPGERWDHDAFYSPQQRSRDKTYAHKLGAIDDMEAFAPRFFGIPPRRAKLMDPQQRLFLDAVRAALEDAGYAARPFPMRRTGVYAGVSVSEHHHLTTLGIHATQLAQGNFGDVDDNTRAAMDPAIANIPPLGPYSMVGQMLNMTAANVAQAFDFTGPVFATDAACSSALVALAEAMLHLRAGVADAAVVGGVYLACTPDNLVAFARIGALSPSDACRPFDRRADGFVLGEGVGALLLKRLEDARRDGDRVWAILRGVGITNDGRAEGPMTPRQAGQELALRLAYEDAGVAPDTIGFVEAHGTATAAGDVAEAGSLVAVYSQLCERPIDTFIGSVKANIGHTIAAAGAAATIKTALALAHRTIPPHAGFELERPELGLAQAGVHIPTRALPWEARSNLPRRAAVSGFGFGGTNVHVIVEEAPTDLRPRIAAAAGNRRRVVSAGADRASSTPPPELFVVSAPTPELLCRHLHALREAATEPAAPAVADIAYTLSRRRLDSARVAFCAGDRAELGERLDASAAVAAGKPAAADGIWLAPAPRASDERIAFLFPGQGAQVVDLCRDVARRWPKFRTRLEALARAADRLLPRPLLSYLHPEADSEAERERAERELTRTEVCQPALAALELALAEFVEELGVFPDVALGHSLGEIVAAAAGGILHPGEAVALVGERGRIMEELALADRGAMAAVAADADTTRSHIGDNRLVVANINHPRQTVVSGETAAIDAFARWSADAGLRVTRLRVSHAFHSPLLAGIDRPLADLLGRQTIAAPRTGVISCVDVGPYPRDPDAIRDLLRRHATSVVDFAGGVRAAWQAGARVFVQVGTGNALLAMARSTLAAAGHTPRALVSLASADNRRGRDLLDGLAALAGAGVTVATEPLYEGRGARLCALPPSPLETQRYWLFPPRQQHAADTRPEPALPRAATQPAPPPSPEQPAPPPSSEQPAPPPSSEQPAAGRDRPVEPTVRELISRVTAVPVESIEPEMRLGGDLGFDSLMAVELSMLVSEEFPAVGELPRSLMRDNATVADVARHVEARAGAAPPSALAPRAADAAGEIRRYRVEPISRPLPRAPSSARPVLAGGAVVLLTGDGDRDVARAVANRLRGAGASAVVATTAAEANLDHATAIADLRFVDPEPVTAAAIRRSILAATATARTAATAGRHPTYLAIGAGASAAGLGGFAAALAREWPEASIKAIEVETELAPDAIAAIVSAEIATTDREPRVEYVGGDRRVATLVPDEIAEPAGGGISAIRDGAVVAISGGGRGLGAVLARALAHRHRARLLLLGRSAANAHTTALIRDVETAGGRALYRRCDVTDSAAVNEALAVARRTLGAIEAVVHAAGVTCDGAIDHKRDQDVARVVDTKVAGALALWNATAADPLRAFLMYGSWAGRFGNAYQTDYAAANAALAWLAPVLARARREVGVVAIDLPPWQGSGMIERLPEPVRRQLRAHGTPFVDDDSGVAHVLSELAAAVHDRRSGEVLLGDERTAMPREDVAAIALDPAAPHLADHRVCGVPVLPMAAALDAAVEAAARLGVTAGPGRAVAALRLELAEGVSVPPGGATLIVTARAEERSGEIGAIEVTLARETAPDEPRTLGYRARVTAVEGALAALLVPSGGRASSLSIDDFYARYSFHGPRMRGIVRVDEVGRGHIRGAVKSGGRGELPRGGVDVLAVDGALQMCGYHTRVTRNAGALPVEIEEARVLAPIPAGATLRCVAVVDEAGDRVISGGVDLLDEGGRALLQLRGVRAKLTEAAARPAEGDTRAAPIPRAAYVIEEFPEVRAIGERIRAAEAMGVRNPYFNVHERVTNETSTIEGREFVNFASYNYLGLSGDEDVNRAAVAAIERYGTSVSASRIASGEKPLHRELERAIADFLSCDDAVVMVSGHATNVSVIGQLVGPGDVVLHDSLAHDSIIGGARMSGVRRQPFPHNNMDALNRLLVQIRPNVRRVLIAVEGVYSMDGDVAALEDLIAIKRRHRALLYVDEAHSIGVLGATGRGIGEQFGIDRRDVDVWMGTLSKSLASCGGYVAGSRTLIQLLKYTNPGFVYSVGMSPPSAAAALAALHKLQREPERVRALQQRSALFLKLLRARGVDTGLASGVAVVPCIVPNSWDCMRLSQVLYERGINAQPIIHPAVDEDQARVRFFITARHTEEQLVTTADAVREALLEIDPQHLKAPEPPAAPSALSTRQARTAP